MTRESPAQIPEIEGARVVAVFGDSITTDHISPTGSFQSAATIPRPLVLRFP
jgi:aconitate hydratase